MANVNKVSRDKIRVQHNPIRPGPKPNPSEVNALRERLGIAGNERVILTVGRLSKEKAQADLIDAFQAFVWTPTPTASWLLLAMDPNGRIWRRFARTANFEERIGFTGQISDVRPFYALADVFVLPSHSEGSPNVLLEAMAARVPVVATSVGGVPEIVQHEASALLVSPQTPAAMAQAIHQILTDDGLAQRLVANACESS